MDVAHGAKKVGFQTDVSALKLNAANVNTLQTVHVNLCYVANVDHNLFGSYRVTALAHANAAGADELIKIIGSSESC